MLYPVIEYYVMHTAMLTVINDWCIECSMAPPHSMAWLMGNHCGDHLVTDASFIWDFTGWNNNNDNNNNKFICETHIEIVIKQFLLLSVAH